LKENRRFLDGFRDPSRSKPLLERIAEIAGDHRRGITLMEVCGTHTTSVLRSGIRALLPENVRLISGPGCPVCVTPNDYLDRAIAISRLAGVVITTFGDMMRVPGTSSSLEREKTEGSDIRVVYSTLDALKTAVDNRRKTVVFLGVGFETTAPTVALALCEAKRKNVGNFSVLSAHKLIPPAMSLLARSPDLKVDGFLCPGHVSTIIGVEPYQFLAQDHKIPCVIAGFEPLDVLQGILLLVQQIKEGKHLVQNQYKRAVRPRGNPKARGLLKQVFDPADTHWRGIGIIPESGLQIRAEYEKFDAEKRIEVNVEKSSDPEGCLCGEVILGKTQPPECRFFGRECIPDSPIGPCMVSSEGTCAAHFKFGQN
jgi:hydrogenase expression/formation protein HypD